MIRLLLTLLLTLWAGAVMAAKPAAFGSGFTFAVPSGWTDVTHAKPDAQLPENLVAMVLAARTQGLEFAAADLQAADAAVMPNVNAIVKTCEAPYTREVIERMAETAPSGSLGALGLEVIASEQVRIGDARCARMVMELNLGGQKIRQLQYHLPSGYVCAVLTYSVPAERFAAYEKTLDDAARATTGLAESPEWSRIHEYPPWLSKLLESLFGALLVGVVVLVVRNQRKSRRIKFS